MEKKRIFIYLCLINLVFLAIPICLNITFATPDDLIFTLILSGDYTGVPSAFTIYTNYIYGYIISHLYSVVPAIEWYSVINYLLSILSFNIFFIESLSSKQNIITKFATIVTLSLVQLYLLLTPNFTVTAFELSLASATILLKKNKSIYYYSVSFILFIIASIIRYHAAFIPYLILFPLYIFPIILKDKSYIIRISFLSSLLISASLLIYINQEVYHSDPSWGYYLKYNSLRGQINDNPSIKKGISSINDPIKKDEYILMSEHWISDGNILSVEDLQNIVYNLKAYRFTNIKTNLISLWHDYKYLLFAFILLLSSVLLQNRKFKKTEILILTACILLTFVALSYTFSISIVKDRVIISVFGTLAVVLAYYINKNSSSPYLYVSLLSLILLFGFKCYNRNETNNLNAEKTRQVEELVSKCKYKKIVFHNAVPISPNIFKISQTAISKKLVRIGWPNNSPLTEKYYNGFISYLEGLPFIATKKNVEKELELVTNIINNHYQKQVRPVIIGENEDFVIIELKEL